MGDGVIYTLASDYRIALNSAFFKMPEINFPLAASMVLVAGDMRRGSYMPAMIQALRCFSGLPLLTLNSMFSPWGLSLA